MASGECAPVVLQMAGMHHAVDQEHPPGDYADHHAFGAVVVGVEGGLRRIGRGRCAHLRAPAHSGLEMRSLVQGESTSARREITGKVLGARPVMAKLGAAAVLGVMNAVTSAATLVRALDRGLPGTRSRWRHGAPRPCRRPGRRGPKEAAGDRVASSGADDAERSERQSVRADGAAVTDAAATS